MYLSSGCWNNTVKLYLYFDAAYSCLSIFKLVDINSFFIFRTTQLETSCLDSSSMIPTDNPYYIRKLAQNNMQGMTSSTNTLLVSTQHFTYRDFLVQMFNRERIEVQTMLSSKVSMFLIVLLCKYIFSPFVYQLSYS